jgi:hypothetical protein
MYARAVDDAAARLRDLRREEWSDLGLAGLALAIALGATEVYPDLALPLFVGAVVVGARGIRAFWRRWDLVDRLAGEADAYVIPEVLVHASREAIMERRRTFAGIIRSKLREPMDARFVIAAGELELLADELEDAGLVLDPVSAVLCMRFVTDPVESPLLNRELPPDEVHSCVHQIRSGFSLPR